MTHGSVRDGVRHEGEQKVFLRKRCSSYEIHTKVHYFPQIFVMVTKDSISIDSHIHNVGCLGSTRSGERKKNSSGDVLIMKNDGHHRLGSYSSTAYGHICQDKISIHPCRIMLLFGLAP